MCRFAKRTLGPAAHFLPAMLVAGAVFATSTTIAPAQEPVPLPGHARYLPQSPPGLVGYQRLRQGGPVVGYFQPVSISAPQEILISLARDGGWTEFTPDTILAGMEIGRPYRLRIGNLPLHPGRECYPTVEIIDRTYPPAGVELKFPIPIVLNEDDLRLALDGMMVTRVVYVEDPLKAVAGSQKAGEQLWHDVGPNANALEVAEQLGRPVAIIRMGGRTPDESQGPDWNFLFGCPKWLHFATNPDAVAGAALPPGTSEVVVIGDQPLNRDAAQALPLIPRECHDAAVASPALPHGIIPPFIPPGIKGPWPMDEYLHDGGDAYEPVGVSPEWRVQGLNPEDTVAHYDTLDGRTLVEQSNCQYVYSPRFSSVRSVVTLVSNDLITGPNNYVKPVRIGRFEERAVVRTNVEQLQPVGKTAKIRPGLYHRDQRDGVISYNLLPSVARLALLPYENVSVIRSGAMQSADKARLAESIQSAIIWTKDEGVRVFLDKTRAVEQTGDVRAQAVFVVQEPEYARLRICKLASTPAALPGEFVEFTLRYDNVGDQVLGNIVLLDSLTTRLEYVDGSATSTRKAFFSTERNDAESLVLRWEIDEPLQPGDGGIARFRCRVR